MTHAISSGAEGSIEPPFQPQWRNCKPNVVFLLLRCPVCQSLLSAPTTLRCGHTVCSDHVKLTSAGPSSSQASLPHTPSVNRLASCPIPACKPAASNRPFHNPGPTVSPRVAYYPPPPVQDEVSEAGKSGSLVKVENPRPDITITRVLALVAGTLPRAQLHLVDSQSPIDLHGSPEPSSEEESGPGREAPSHPIQPLPQRSSSRRSFRQGSLSRSNSSGRNSVTSVSSQHVVSRPLSQAIPPAPSQGTPGTPVAGSSRPARSRTPPSAEGSPDSSTRCRHPHLPKRRRLRRPSTPSHSAADAQFATALNQELQCEICFSLLHNPITTPCQHTFCSKCLSRTLDHSSLCPLCRQELPGYSYFHDHATNATISGIISRVFPEAHKLRNEAMESEAQDSNLNTPVFVCQLSFPGMPTLLHLFEPRYRLMLRRCLQAPNPSFGMIMPPGNVGEGLDYGTMLEILSVQMLPDGRSMVETRGTYRFRILERGIHDGYMVSRIERIDDYDPAFEQDLQEIAMSASLDVPSEPRNTPATSSADASSSSVRIPEANPLPLRSTSERGDNGEQGSWSASLALQQLQSRLSAMPSEPSNEELVQVCRDFYEQLCSGTAPWVVQQLNNTYGVMPEDPSTFSFWMALLLPIDEREKAKLLPIRSARLRLKLIVYWIETLNNSWWFPTGCVIS